MRLSVHYKIFKDIIDPSHTENCIKNGSIFCVVNSSKKQNLDTLNETVKQLCLFNQNLDHFTDYLQKLRHECFEGEDIKDSFKSCSEEVFNAVVPQVYKEKLSICRDPKSKELLELLERNNDHIKYYLVNYSPIVFINGFIYKGNYADSDHLIESFCNSFENIPKKCKNLNLFSVYSNFSSWGLLKFFLSTIIIAVISFFIIIGLFYLLYRKKIKKTFKKELDHKINEALTKFYEDGQKSNYKGINNNSE